MMNKKVLKRLLVGFTYCLLLAACQTHQTEGGNVSPTQPLPISSPIPSRSSEPTAEVVNIPTTATPSPEWKVYTSPYNLTLQIPSHWQRQGSRPMGSDDGFFHLGPPEVTFLQNSGSEGFDLADICNAPLETNSAMENKLGYKPYGEDPQLEFLEVDGQPACLFMPSTDQNEAGRGRAEFIIQLPAYFPSRFHAPPLFGFVQLTSDKKHIRDISQTIRFDQPQAFEDDSNPFSPAVIGELELAGQRVSSLALDEKVVYWTLVVEQSPISRYSLESTTINSDYLTTQFEGGTLNYIDPIIKNHQLVYLDVDPDRTDFTWKLQALDLENGAKQNVLEANSDNESWPGPSIDFDGEWVAWTRTKKSDDQACTKSILGVTNLNTDEQKIIEELCADNGPYLWSAVGISNNTLVAEQDLPDSQGAGNDLFLYNLQDGQVEQLTDNGHSSMPVIAYPWIVWKDAPRFEWGHQNVIYDLRNQSQQIIDVPGNNSSSPDPRLEGHWLYWNIINDRNGTGVIYLYDLEQSQMWKMVAPHRGEVFDDVAIDEDMIVWSRRPLEGQGSSTLEWAYLP